MIKGIGTDIVKISRIQSILNQNYKQNFLRKVLSDYELQNFETKNEMRAAQFVAGRWAVKEATIKALGIRELVFSSMTLSASEKIGGSYTVVFGEKNIQRFGCILDFKNICCFASISHEDEFAIAFVVAQQIS